MTWVLLNLVSDCLEILLVSVEDWCTVCAKRCIGLDIVFNAATMVLLGDEAQVEAHFSPCGDSANCNTPGVLNTKTVMSSYAL